VGRLIFRAFQHKCTGVHIFGDAKNFCPNLILLSRITLKQQALMLRLKRTIVIKVSACLIRPTNYRGSKRYALN